MRCGAALNAAPHVLCIVGLFNLSSNIIFGCQCSRGDAWLSGREVKIKACKPELCYFDCNCCSIDPGFCPWVTFSWKRFCQKPGCQPLRNKQVLHTLIYILYNVPAEKHTDNFRQYLSSQTVSGDQRIAADIFRLNLHVLYGSSLMLQMRGNAPFCIPPCNQKNPLL